MYLALAKHKRDQERLSEDPEFKSFAQSKRFKEQKTIVRLV